MKIAIILCSFICVGCASTSQLTFDEQVIDEYDQIIDDECAIKNSVPSIHDELS